MDALEPSILRGLFQQAIDAYWDEDAYQTTLRKEARDRVALDRLIAQFQKGRR